MYQLMKLLGKNYVVWDKSATINITPEFVSQIKKDIAEQQTKDYVLNVPLKDIDGKVYANVDCTLYVARKAYYQSRKTNKQ